MTLTALDSDGPIPGAELRAAGITAVGRYLALPGTPKGVTPAELADLKASGVAVWFGFEIETYDVTGGYSLGVQHAQWANETLAALGLPSTQPVYFAVDETVDSAAAVSYFQGVASVRPSKTNGAYASGAVILRLFTLGLIGYGWQSGSRGWLTNAATLPETAIQQQTETTGPFADTDGDVIYKSDFGQYPRPAPPEEEMPLKIVTGHTNSKTGAESEFVTNGLVKVRCATPADVVAFEKNFTAKAATPKLSVEQVDLIPED